MRARNIAVRVIALLVFGTSACRSTADSATHTSAPSAAVGTAAPTRSVHPADEVDRLDARTPLPLLAPMALHQKESMRDHLRVVEEIVSALASDDLSQVKTSAVRIASSEAMGRQCAHMGRGAPGFTQQALAFHRTADAIASAAESGDRSSVLRELGSTLRACVGCHESYKQRVVDEGDWHRLNGAAAHE